MKLRVIDNRIILIDEKAPKVLLSDTQIDSYSSKEFLTTTGLVHTSFAKNKGLV